MNSRNWFSRRGFLELARSKAAKFVLAGLVNTGSTYLLYLFLLLFLDYRISYAISYVAGIGIAFALNSKLVFKAKFNVIRMLIYPLIYVFQYFANALLLDLFVDRLGLPEEIAPLLAICITLPLVYLLNKLILTASLKKQGSEPGEYTR